MVEHSVKAKIGVRISDIADKVPIPVDRTRDPLCDTVSYKYNISGAKIIGIVCKDLLSMTS